MELGFKFQTYGKQHWQQYQRYPQMGISMGYFNLGNKDVIGSAFAIFPTGTFSIMRRKRGYIQFQLGTGLAYLTKSYDPNSNPSNNAIGSKINNITALRFDGGYKLNKNTNIHLGVGFTHFSNGGSQKPNLGINIISGVVGIKYTPNAVPQEEYIFDEEFLNVPQKRWGFQMHFDMAYKEFATYGGPRYPIYIGSLGTVFHFNAVNRMVFGFEAEYNVGVYHYIDHLFSDKPTSELNKAASRFMFFVADEIMLGKFGIYLQLGIYIHKGEATPGLIYNKLSLRYYLPPVGKPATQFFALVYLKNHTSVAEYIGFGFGAHL